MSQDSAIFLDSLEHMGAMAVGTPQKSKELSVMSLLTEHLNLAVQGAAPLQGIRLILS